MDFHPVHLACRVVEHQAIESLVLVEFVGGISGDKEGMIAGVTVGLHHQERVRVEAAEVDHLDLRQARVKVSPIFLAIEGKSRLAFAIVIVYILFIRHNLPCIG